MKVVRLISAIALLLSVFVSLDLGLNALASVIPSMNDGIGNFSVLHGLFGIFGDNSWSHELYYNAFKISAWITYALFTENIILGVVNYLRKA